MSEIAVELRGLAELSARLDAMEPTVRTKLRVFMAAFTIRLREQVKVNIVARFASTGPLYQAVQSDMSESPSGFTGRAYVEGIPYAAIQEYGGRTSQHTIVPVNAAVLAFMSLGSIGLSAGGGASALVFAKRVNHPGSNIPERSYARAALAQLRDAFTTGIRGVVAEAAGLPGAFAMAAE